MPTLFIFNPEHDLCLANGDIHFMPPQSALRFAEAEAHWMQVLGSDIVPTTALRAGDEFAKLRHQGQVLVKAWGWNATLRHQLLCSGIPNTLLPSPEQITAIRRLSHRATALSIQKNVEQLFSLTEAEDYLAKRGRIVLKAPWSGSGRGLRWVDHTLSPHDKSWIAKILATQGSILGEPRQQVVQDFAFLFHATNSRHVELMGYSLFDTQSGVYRGNRLLTDEEIVRQLSEYVSQTALENARQELQQWLSENAADYQGPIGVDAYIYQDAADYHLRPCVEINFRHTMGMVAHQLTLLHPELQHTVFVPTTKG